MTIKEFLMDCNAEIRYYGKYLFMDTDGYYHVYERKYCSKKVKRLYDGKSESEAIDVLVREETE